MVLNSRPFIIEYLCASEILLIHPL